MSDTHPIPEDLQAEYLGVCKGIQLLGWKAKLLIEWIAKLKAENTELREKVARLEAPVSDKEWEDNCVYGYPSGIQLMDRIDVDRVIRFRAAVPEGK